MTWDFSKATFQKTLSGTIEISKAFIQYVRKMKNPL